MKTVFCLYLLLVAAQRVAAQVDTPLPAQTFSKRWIVTLKVMDEIGQPVTNAQAAVSYFLPTPLGEEPRSGRVAGFTSSNGTFTASNVAWGYSLGFHIEKNGYYPTFHQYQFDARERREQNIEIQEQTLLLRRIGSPIPMYAKRAETKIQKESEPVGYDLMVGDWVAPHGTGKTTDLFFTARRKVISPTEYDADLKLTFPNMGDGISIAPAERIDGSAFSTSRTAAESGYESERGWHYSNTGGPEPVFGYFIRVRTVLDENGKVRSALYGKIRGDFRFYVGTKAPRAGMGFDYYLNPIPNNRNVEFDPTKNLMKKLGPSEHVNEP